jgi:hypothetical protein
MSFIVDTDGGKGMKIIRFLTLAIIGFGLVSGHAIADNGQGKNKGKNYSDHKEHRSGEKALIAIDIRDRDVIRNYLHGQHAPNCPPGLAKKHNGCLPPGIAKKYTVGQPLPAWIVYHPIPADLRELLHPIPAGYQYLQVDKDILLVAEASKKVIDAVTLLSAVGK